MSATINAKLYQAHSLENPTSLTRPSSLYSSSVQSPYQLDDTSPNLKGEVNYSYPKSRFLEKYCSDPSRPRNENDLLKSPQSVFSGVLSPDCAKGMKYDMTSPPMRTLKGLGDSNLNMDELSEHDSVSCNSSAVRGKMPFASPSMKTLNDVKISHSFVMTRSLVYTAESQQETLEARFTEADVALENHVGRMSKSLFRSALMQEYSNQGEDKKRKVFLDVNILGSIVSFLNCKDVMNFKKIFSEYRNSKLYTKIFKQRLLTLAVKGFSLGEQFQYWDSFLNFQSLERNHLFTFLRRVAEPCSFASEIEKDLDRTLPEYEKYSTEEGKTTLFRVLAASANAVKEVGYVQGLNSIAGVLLFFLGEEKSFWMMLYLLKKVNMKDFLQDNLKNLHLLNYQFQAFLENYIPDISDYLQVNGITVDYFLTPWIITLFSYCLNFSNTLKLWNILFVKGTSFLIQFGLAIFATHKSTILNMDFDELGNFLKETLRQ